MRNRLYAIALAVMAWTSGCPALAQQPVLQRGYDPGVSGANLNETTLNISNVNPTTFGLVFNLPVDDNVYAQPLYVPQVTIPNKGIHNVVYVATMSDTLYAFDADHVGAPLWSVNLATSVGAVPVSIAQFAFGGNANITGNLGILSTPVIDPSTNIMYLVACTLERGTMVYRLHAVNIVDGTEPYANVVIRGSYNGVTFDAPHQTQRVSLTLSGNEVVFGFGAVQSEAADTNGYSGWVMAYDKRTLVQSGSFASVTTGSSLGGGVWQSGRPPVVDSAGFVYVFSGNAYNGNGYNGDTNFSESALRLDPSDGLALVDWFTPASWTSMDKQDLDLSSAGPLLIPNTNPSLLAGGGKTGTFYVLNTSNLGQFTATDSGAVQEYTIGASSLRGGPVYWQRSAANSGPLLYDWATNDPLRAFAFNGTTFATTPASVGSSSQVYPGGILTLSANGQQQGTGVLWATVMTGGDGFSDPADPGVLYAFDADNVATQLYSSNTNSSRDNFGNFAKFVPPLVVNGKVYVATFSDKVAVYGLLNPSAPVAAQPTFSPAPGTYTGTQAVALSDATNGAVIYYTTNGTTPTTASAQYVPGARIALSASETISAIAVASGYMTSAVAIGSYTISASGTGSAPVSVALSLTPDNIYGLGTVGTATTNGGLDGRGDDYAAALLGTSITWSGSTFAVGGANVADMVSSATIPLPSGSYATLKMLATGMNGAQNANFVVTYTDGTTTTINQTLSDWYTPQRNPIGESIVMSMGYRILPNGTVDNRTYNLYGYSFALNSTKTVKSLTLPNNRSVVVLAIDLVPASGSSPVAATPTFSLAPGTYTGTQSVTLSDVTSGAVIYYTTNGTTPTTASAKYVPGTPISVNASEMIEAIAVASGYTTSAVTIGSYTISGQPVVGKPTFSPSPGSYTGTQPVTLSDATGGAVIYYTTNGTTPTTASAKYVAGTPITVNASETLEAIAVASGYTPSAVASGSYTISASGSSGTGPISVGLSPTADNIYGLGTVGTATSNGGLDGRGDDYAAALLGTSITWSGATFAVGGANVADMLSSATIALPSGSYATLKMLGTGVNGAQNVTFVVTYTDGTTTTISQTLSDWYTPQKNPVGESIVMSMAYRILPNGTADNRTYNLYGYSFALNGAKTVQSLTLPNNRNVVVLAIDLVPTSGSSPVAATPTFSPAPGSYTGTQPVSLSDATGAAVIYYTTDGTTPTIASAQYVAGTPIPVSASETIEAIAVASGYTPSAVASGIYTISALPTAAAPTFGPVPGSYSGTQPVTLSDATSGAVIYYTTDGTTPTVASAQYVAGTPIPVSASETIEAIAVASGYTPSAVASGIYTISALPTAAAPTFSPAPGSYTGTQPVSLSDATGGAVIYYTTDGTTPTTASAQYVPGTPMSVSATETISAIAVANGFTTSAVASGTYTISTSGTSGTGPVSVALSPVDNIYGLGTVGTATRNGGLDGRGDDYAAALLGTSITWSGSTFTIGGANVADMVSNATIPLPPGSYTTLKILGTGTNGAQKTTFVVTYSDGTTTTINQTLSDWHTPQNYSGESIVTSMGYRILPNGTADNRTYNLYGYSFALNSAKTVQSLALPNNRNVVVLAIDLVPATGSLPTAATPTFSPAPGSYSGTQPVTLSDATGGAVIYYTTDGTTPTIASAQYVPGTPISVSASETISAIAVASGYTTSTVASGIYTISALPTAATPTLSPAPGSYSGTQPVTLSDATGGAAIYYTTDGTTPTTASAQYVSGTPIAVSATETISAIAVASGYAPSAVASGIYAISALPPAATPTFSPVPGTYSGTQPVTLSDATGGAAIYYTTDGTTPTTASAQYVPGTPIAVSVTETITAIAVAGGYTTSALASGIYTISAQPVAATPTFSPAPGTYTATQPVTLSDATGGALIYYTTDGTTPTTASAQYVPGTPIAVSVTETITAIAVAGGYTTSALASGIYTISTQPLGGTPTLTGSQTSANTTANITTEGALDWVQWGDSALDRKSGVTAQLSTYSVVGSSGVNTYGNDPRGISWSDGTPTATATADTNGVYIPGTGNGFSFTAPASTTTQVLTVHVGGYYSGGTLTASLGDGSAPNFVSTTAAVSGQYDANYTLTYTAGSTTTLTVTWVMSSGTGNVTLNAAALSY